MGPTNVALVKLFRADQAMRDAQERLDAATKNVRVQERRVNDTTEKQKAAQTKHKELQVKSGNLDLDLRTRDAHLEKLRTQQQTAKNNKEYQTFLIEINTQKVDKAKVEEETMAVMQQVETAGKESAELVTILESEKQKLSSLKTQIGDTIVNLQVEIDSLKGPRDALAATLPPKARIAFDRLADHHDGEALSSVIKPDRRREEYVCSSCMMDLVTDVYNKLHTRDELVFCPSCRRILYIPDDLPIETAVHKKKVTTGSLANAGASAGEAERPKEAPRARGRVGEILAASQGESVKNAVDAQQDPIEFHVTVDGRVVGDYKGKNAENLERIIRFRFDEAGLKHEVHVNPVVLQTPAAAPPPVPPTPAPEPASVAEATPSTEPQPASAE
jgi:predicted  nucleic acid-binding Zn-ribbon protein